MGNCKGCAYWDNSDGYLDTRLRTCKKVVMLWNATEFDYKTDTLKLLPKYQDCLAFAQDGSDYRAYLLTFAEFGCVQFSPAT